MPGGYEFSKNGEERTDTLGRLRHLQLGNKAGDSALELPQLELHNASGWFSLRATQLVATVGERRAVGIEITQRVATVTRLLPALRTLSLPQRQEELAYWLARGLPEDEIAGRMGISGNTATYHRRQVYTRLGVHSRKELQAVLSVP